jgi:small-conductance mechanosensitive channel
MMLKGERIVCSRVAIVLAAFLYVALGGLSLAAQPALSDATQQKIDQLAKLLSDPDVRAVVSQRSKEAPADDAMPGSSANEYTIWMNRVRDHLNDVVAAVPLVPGEFEKARETTMTGINDRRPITVFLFFLLLVGIGRAAEFLFERFVGRVHLHKHMAHPDGAARKGYHILGRHLFAEIAPLVVFGIASISLFLSFSWPPLLTELIVPTLLGVIVGRFVIRIAKLLLTAFPNTGREGYTRLIPIDRAAARFWFRRIATFVSIFFFGWAANGIMLALGFLTAAREVVVYALGLVLLAAAVEMAWHRPRLAEHRGHHGAFDWLLVFWLCLLWVLWVAGANLVMWLGAYLILIPTGLKIVSAVTHSSFLRSSDAPDAHHPVLEVLIERSGRAIFIALAAFWLATVLRLDSAMMMGDEPASRILRGVLSGVVILLAADLIWQMTKAFIEHALTKARAAEADATESARYGRLLTLLPILRNFLAVLIAVIAVLTVLSGLGVEIGPLIAGAGIFGVAIGFGSQTLVKDVISGVFYMLDDAFRVGEYIQSGNYKGTVESFSIRSVRLRHHRGPVFTVPFGVLGAVENLSRDWAIDKFKIAVAFNTDLAKVKKLVKGVGAKLLEDPEIGPQILETVKLKGLEEFSDYGITISFAMTTKPGYQSGVRRRAYVMIREVFTENGIEFASPTIQVANEERKAGVEGAPTAAIAPTAPVAALAASNAIPLPLKRTAAAGGTEGGGEASR